MTRSEELRRRHRKILGWSLGLAAVAHLAVLFLTPPFETVPLPASGSEREESDSSRAVSAEVDILFGPPVIWSHDGSLWPEPPERHLEARRGVQLPALCAGLARPARAPVRGRVRLRVSSTGQAEVMRLTESSGDLCADRVLTDVANSLLYRWLPNERFPAPVELLQPVTLTAVRD
ncbi:MAG: hypothetical protein PVI57_10970 [Gemmatimonadota bacterium]|jgi:hypothetical protein